MSLFRKSNGPAQAAPPEENAEGPRRSLKDFSNSLVFVLLVVFVGCQVYVLVTVTTARLSVLSDAYEVHLFSIFWLSVAVASHVVSKRLPQRFRIEWLQGLLAAVKYIALALFAVDVFTNLLLYLQHPDRFDAALFMYALGPILYLIFWKLPNRHLAQWRGKPAADDYLSTKDYLTLENSVRTTFIQIVGGVLVLLGLYFTSQNISLTLERAQSEQLDKAVTMLESPESANGYKRALAINNLEKLADASWNNYKLIREIFADQLKRLAAPPNDSKEIKEIISFLGRRPHLRGTAGEQLPPLDLSGIDLRGANLSDVQWPGVILASARLEGVNFNNAVLNGANFGGAHLNGTDFSDATLNDAVFDNATLSGARMNRTSISGAHLRFSDITQEQVSTARCVYATDLPQGQQCKETPSH